MQKIALLALFFLFAASPAFAQDKETIQARDDALAAAFNRGDVAAVKAFYTEDAVVLPAGGDMVQGKGLLPFWKAVVARIDKLKRTAVDVKPLGANYAREIGTFTFSRKRELTRYDGKYVVIWQKRDGDWLIATDIWNLNRWPGQR